MRLLVDYYYSESAFYQSLLGIQRLENSERMLAEVRAHRQNQPSSRHSRSSISLRPMGRSMVNLYDGMPSTIVRFKVSVRAVRYWQYEQHGS